MANISLRSPPLWTLLLWPLLALSASDGSTITITVSPAPSATSPSYTSPSDLQSSALNSTNTYRYQHSTPALVWNDSLASIAQSYSSKCLFQHSGTPDIGENLAMGYPDVTSAIDGWGNERVNYSWSNPGFSEGTGHFTQLVWKDTRSTGCGVTECNGTNGVDGWLLVCEYYPQGNVIAPSNPSNTSPSSSSSSSSSSSAAAAATTAASAAAAAAKNPAASYFPSNVPPQAHSNAMPAGWEETATAPLPSSTADGSGGGGGGVQVSPAPQATITVGVKSGGSKVGVLGGMGWDVFWPWVLGWLVL